MSQLNEIASKSLGSENSYAVFTDQFDSSLLNPMPRSIGRQEWGIDSRAFIGFDVWHCHESTFLLDSGSPIAGTLKFIYPSTTEFMIESKSMKLYLNSFDMCKMGATAKEAIKNYEDQIRIDLISVLNCSEVQVKFFSETAFNSLSKPNLLKDSTPMVSEDELASIVIDDYKGISKHLTVFEGQTHIKTYSNVLRSRCRHTKQKDTGLALISLDSETHGIDRISLFKQLVSLRETAEFHELCSEVLFTAIHEAFRGDITIALLYSRRGSLDICPIRSSSLVLLADNPLVDVSILTQKVQGQ